MSVVVPAELFVSGGSMDTKNSILSLRGVKKQYSGAPNPAIEDITLDI